MSTPATLVLAPDPASVRRARALVKQVCREAGLSDDAVDAAVLLTSETVTNAFTHGRSEARLCALPVARGRRVRVEVSDDDSRHPHRAPRDEDSLSGRGLALVDALAASWGVRDDRYGKTVWFEVGP